MPDTYTLHLQNFRSIRDARVEIAPLTVVYGPNGSGKSSLIYGLLTLKNFLTNPSQNLSSLFSYPSISLAGGRKWCIATLWTRMCPSPSGSPIRVTFLPNSL